MGEKQEGDSAAGRRLVTMGEKIGRMRLPEQGRSEAGEEGDKRWGHTS